MNADCIYNYLCVLFFEDKCVVSNPYTRKISGFLPKPVGEAVLLIRNGADIALAVKHINKTQSLTPSETVDVLRFTTFLSGMVEGFCPPTSSSFPSNKFGSVLLLCPTTDCNLSCVYCTAGSAHEKIRKMPLSLATAAVDFFLDNSHTPTGNPTLQFHGAGEPTVEFGFLQSIVSYAKKKCSSFEFRITTNGFMSTSTAEWISKNINHVTLSFDGPPAIQNRNRPTKNSDRSYDIVLRSAKIFEIAGILKTINIVVTPDDVDSLSHTVAHILTSVTVPFIRILPLAMCDKAREAGIAPIEPKSLVRSFRQAKRVAESLGTQLVLNKHPSDIIENYCGACGYNMVLSPDGSITTCHEVLFEENPGYGEMRVGFYQPSTESFHVDWDKLNSLRKRSAKNMGTCQDCEIGVHCGGGCAARAARHFGTIFERDPEYCHYMRKLIEDEYIALAESLASPDNPLVSQKNTTDIIKYSQVISKLFSEIQNRDWTIDVVALELTKQVGDLTRRLLTREGYYHNHRHSEQSYTGTNAAIADELADIFLGIVRVAEHYKIDLHREIISSRDHELKYIRYLKKQEMSSDNEPS